MAWEIYDPSWLISLAAVQKPELVAALKEIKFAKMESPAYYYFVDAKNPNKEGSAWQFARNALLEDKKLGTIVLDVLKDGKIGGVEIVSKAPLN